MSTQSNDPAAAALAAFSPATREWFTRAFAAPTAAQVAAWPAISSGEHVLLSAPTGSGKTLAAFLWAIDRLAAERRAGEAGAVEPGTRGQGDGPQPKGISLVYVSPLKALSYDIDRNLRVPLAGIGAQLSVAVRTGDTPQVLRQRMLREPPDILITTPESLYLMLTGKAQALFETTRWCIVDEIHAVAATKRGAHLALTLERLSALSRSASGPAAVPELQRIGLSATQNPLAEIARFMVGPGRQCRVIDTGIRKALDLEIQVPVESMVNPDDTPGGAELDPLAGGTEPTLRSIWPAIYPQLLALVREHHSTIIFVNARRAAERLALRLNELAAGEDREAGRPEREIARAHHGSLAREERTVVEELLKSGQLPCLVATSSLELGIDMGAVDLVIQVESPKSVAAGLQRIGRAGHNVGEVSRGRIFPKFRADLLECAVVAARMRAGEIEQTVVPRNALDVLAQQIVAICAAAETYGEQSVVGVEELFELVTRTYSYAELGRASFENVLDMLDGRYPSSEFSELRPRIVWDRVGGSVRARPGARMLAVTNAGTIPDRGLYAVTLPDGRRVGELDEEMVYEARVGQTFLLGASSWRIEEITRDKVVVTPAPGAPGAVPFWRGDSVGRPAELGEAIGAFSRWAVDQEPSSLQGDYDLDRRAAVNLVEFLREQRDATRVLPSDRVIVIERFRDEIGDWRMCVLSPYGGRVHAAWSMALGARIRERLGVEADAIYADDGIIVHLPDGDELEQAELAELVAIAPDEIEDLVIGELSGSALFGARFRENAARALLIPRAMPGRRTPLWQQRLKAQSLLEVASRYREFPIVLETYRECVRDVLDLPALRRLLGRIAAREVSLVEVETTGASPFASSLLFDYVATYMYEGDTPNAERRAAALSLDRDLLRELLGQEELRDLIDADALAAVEADLQWRSAARRVANVDELHDLLRVVGDLTVAEIGERVAEGVSGVDGMLTRLIGERRAVRVRIGGEERYIAAADAGMYRDALGVVPPGGLPEAFLTAVAEPLTRIVARFAATHGPFVADRLRVRYGVDCGAVLRAGEHEGTLVQGELRPGGSGREWCDPDVLRRLRRASLAVLRHEVEPVGQRALARFLPGWQGIDRFPGSGAGVDRLRDVLAPLQGVVLPLEIWEREVLPRRVGAYSQSWLDQLCAAGEIVWVGAGSLGRSSGRVALYFREDLPLLGAPASKVNAEAFETPLHLGILERLAGGACFFEDLVGGVAGLTLEGAAAEGRAAEQYVAEGGPADANQVQAALWDLVWAGLATNDGVAPLRAPRLKLAGSVAAARAYDSRSPRFAARRRTRARTAGWVAGRWSLVAPLLEPVPDPVTRRRALAELMLERYGVLTRELALAEGIRGGFSGIYPELGQLETLGVARRGYFVEGLGGAQFALPGAVERLRDARGELDRTAIVLSAVDPAQPYGAALSWPAREDGRERGLDRERGGESVRDDQDLQVLGHGRRRVGRGERAGGKGPARQAGAQVVLIGGEPIVYLERGGKSLLTLVAGGDERVTSALAALSDHVRSGRGSVRRVALETIDGEPAQSSPLLGDLIAVGFEAGPRRLTLSA